MELCRKLWIQWLDHERSQPSDCCDPTPVIGAHYIIDIVGGAVAAAGSVLLAKHLFRSLLPRASLVLKEVHQPELCFNIKAAAKSFR